MTAREYGQVWAPAISPWTRWSKPVLLAHLSEATPTPAEGGEGSFSTSHLPAADGRSILVADLPGAGAVHFGVRLAMIAGWRPIPQYNALPGPAPGVDGDHNCAVDVRSILDAMASRSAELARAPLPPSAPPVFLLDRDRRGGPVAREFDNRSVSLPTDFPSANYLLSEGVQQVVLVQEDERTPEADLAHTLLRWQRAGLRILLATLGSAEEPRETRISPPSGFGSIWHNFLVNFGLRSSQLGGYGGELTDYTAAGG